MKCEVCKKGTASLYRFMATFGKQVPVCVVCFQKSTVARKNSFEGAISGGLLDELTKALTNFQPTNEYFPERDVPKKSRGAVCSNCGFEFEEYFDKGRFGCVKCYDVFHAQIRSLVYKIHGCVKHNGSRQT
jgi:protein arginine kinase activator